ncbi:MAG TPA: hypothetical protein DCL21_02970 [Alphaproteobacteria bacterium]|nr:hypothetical protein [Alphaproteobacteria bacterium]
MQLKTNDNKYGVIRKLNHWTVSIMFISLLAVGFYMADIPASPEKWELYAMHKSFGAILLPIILIRMLWLAFDNKIDNSKLTKLERIGSASLHGSLYLLMLIMPVSGMLMSMAKGYAINVFGLFTLPMLVEKNEALGVAMANVHFYAGNVAAGLILMHVLASLFHHFIKKDDILKRMV